MADNEHPPRRDLEPRATPPVDPEQYRQFEQFQQFQQFMAFKEAQGEGAAPPQLPGKQRPTWQKILLSKAVRKLAYLAVVILALVWAFNYFFPGPVDDGLGQQGAAGPGHVTDPGRQQPSPGLLVQQLYLWASDGSKPDNTAAFCTRLFSETGKAAFVRDFGGPDCETVVRRLDADPKVLPIAAVPIIDDYNKQELKVSSCRDVQLRPGGIGLGKLTLVRQGTGWVIGGHEPEPDPCPVATSTTTPSTTKTTN